MRSLNFVLFLFLFLILIFSTANAAPTSGDPLGDCTNRSPKCIDVFKSGLGTTGEGILSLEKGVEINKTRKGADANLIFGAASQCKTVNPFGDGSICQYQPNHPKCNDGNCKTSGNATMCLTKRDLGGIDGYTDGLTVGNPWTFVVGQVTRITEPNTINAMYLNSGSTVVIDQIACAASGHSKCQDVFTIYLNALHLHTGANLIINGKVKLYIKYFGFGTWITSGGSKIIVPKGSSLEIRANDWVRFSSEIYSLSAPGEPYSSIIVDGKLKVYALGADTGKLDLSFDKKSNGSLLFKKSGGQNQTYLTTCTDENTTRKQCTYLEDNKSVQCQLNPDLSNLIDKDWCSKTPKKSQDGSVYEVDCNRSKAAGLMASAKYENGKITHSDSAFKEFLEKNDCYLNDDNATACKKDSPFSWTLSQAQCYFDENASVKCNPDATNYSYCYVTAERQNGNIRFEPGLRLFVNPETRASAQFFAKGDIIAGERWDENTLGSYGAVQLNWSKVEGLDDYIKCRTKTGYKYDKNKGDVECKVRYRDHNDSAGLGMYAGGQIRIHDGSKVQGLLYSASSENEKAPGKEAAKRYYGTPYCSPSEQKACITAFTKDPDGEGHKKQQECSNAVNKCWHDCKNCYSTEYNSCHTKCENDCKKTHMNGSVDFTKLSACKIKCTPECKTKSTTTCSTKYGVNSCASDCRTKFGLDWWRVSDRNNCWVNKIQPELKNLCIQGIGYAGLSKAIVHNVVPKRSKSCQVKLLCNDAAKEKGDCKDNPYARDLSKDKNYGIYLGAGTTLKGSAVSKYVVAEKDSKIVYDENGVAKSRAKDLCNSNTPPEMKRRVFNVIGQLKTGETIGNVEGFDYDEEDVQIGYKVLKGSVNGGEDYSDYFMIDNGGNLKFKKDLPENLRGKKLEFRAKIYSGKEIQHENGNIEYPGGVNIQTITVTACHEVGLINIFNVNMQKEVSQLSHSGTPNSEKVKINAMATRIAGKPFDLKAATACKFPADKTLSFDLGLYENGKELAKYDQVVLSKHENYTKTLKITVDKAHKSLTLKATNVKFGEGNKTNKIYTSDTFSVRPKNLVFPEYKDAQLGAIPAAEPMPRKFKNLDAKPPVMRDVLVTGQKYTVKVKSPVDGFVQPVQLKAGGEHGKTELLENTQGHVAKIGKDEVPGVVINGMSSQDLNLSYNGVGNVDLTLRDENWTNVDKPENPLNPSEPDKEKWECKENFDNNCSDFGKLCSCDTTGIWEVAFVPDKYDVTLDYTTENGQDYTFFRNDYNWAVLDFSVRPLDAKGNVIKDYAADLNYTLRFNKNGKEIGLTKYSKPEGDIESNPKTYYILEEITIEEKKLDASISDISSTSNKKDLEAPSTDDSFANDLTRTISKTAYGEKGANVKVKYSFARHPLIPQEPLQISSNDISLTMKDFMGENVGVKITGKGSTYFLYARINPQDLISFNKGDAKARLYYEAFSSKREDINKATEDKNSLSRTAVNWWIIDAPSLGAGRVAIGDITTSDDKFKASKDDIKDDEDGRKYQEVEFKRDDTIIPSKVRAEIDLDLSGKSYLFYHPYSRVEKVVFFLDFRNEKTTDSGNDIVKNKNPNKTRSFNRLGE